jgi:hypothetical protein
MPEASLEDRLQDILDRALNCAITHCHRYFKYPQIRRLKNPQL